MSGAVLGIRDRKMNKKLAVCSRGSHLDRRANTITEC